MPEISAPDQAHSWYRMTLECDGHGFNSSCQCKERMQEVLVDLYDQLRRGPSQGIWQIVDGLEEMGALEKGVGGCPDSRIFAGIRELKERGEKSEENYQFMVKKAIDKHLPAYREMGTKLAAMEGERDEALGRLDAAIGLRELDTEFVCAFMRTVRELESRLPPIPATRWIEAAQAFIDKARTEPVSLPPGDRSWKDTWDRAEKAENERDACIAQYNAESKQVFEAEAQRDEARVALERTLRGLEQSLAGTPIRDADEIILHAQSVLGESNA